MYNGNDYDRLKEMLNGTKEDAPITCSMFREFLNNHFAHLKARVAFNTKLLWIILGTVLGMSGAIIVAVLSGSLGG